LKIFIDSNYKNILTHLIKNAKNIFYKSELAKTKDNLSICWKLINNFIFRGKKQNNINNYNIILNN